MPILGSLERLSAALHSGELTSVALTQKALAEASRPSGEGPATFTRLYDTSAVAEAETIDAQHRAGMPARPLAGIPISIKDIFDVAGETTRAGSVVLADAEPAVSDAPAVARLKQAGAILIGRTNMTEFAYSGLGLNPHYGTPRNPYERARARIPGGSSSGAAISVTDGMAAAALGTDTGGSLRIPAALCGLTGFKPTARRIPTDGVLPLSTSLDSVGPIALTVACCSRIDAVISGKSTESRPRDSVRGLRLGCLQGYVLDDLDTAVAHAFNKALSILSRAGAHIEQVTFAHLPLIAQSNSAGGFAAAESYAWHRRLIERDERLYDPRVGARIKRGKQMSAADYVELVWLRARIIKEAERAFQPFDAWMTPTVPRIAPEIADLERDDAAYFDANAAMLRNPSIVNFLDGCALSIPCHAPGEAPVGLMVAARHGQDEHLLSLGGAIEVALRDGGCAIHGGPAGFSAE